VSSLSIDSVLWWISTQIGGSSPFSLRLLLLLAMFISIDNDSEVGFPESKVLEILSKGSCLSEELRKCITPTAARSIWGIHFISCHVIFLLESNRQRRRHTYRYSFISKLVYPILWSISFSLCLPILLHPFLIFVLLQQLTLVLPIPERFLGCYFTFTT